MAAVSATGESGVDIPLVQVTLDVNLGSKVIFHQANSTSVMWIFSLWVGSKDFPHEPSPHWLVNMMVTYNTLEKKLVDFVSACHCYVYDVIRSTVQSGPAPTYSCAYKCMSGL